MHRFSTALVALSQRRNLVWFLAALAMVTYGFVQLAWRQRLHNPLLVGDHLTALDWVMGGVCLILSGIALIIGVVAAFTWEEDEEHLNGFGLFSKAVAALLALTFVLLNYLTNHMLR